MSHIDPATLDRWQAVCDAATAGPCYIQEDKNDQPCLYGANGHWIALYPHQCVALEQAHADAAFDSLARTALPLAIAALRERAWRPIDDDARSGKPVLCVYRDSQGRDIAHAKYIARFTERRAYDCGEGNDEYCEADDEYYTTEGWYEICEAGPDYNSWRMDAEPMLYMGIPAPPQQGGEG